MSTHQRTSRNLVKDLMPVIGDLHSYIQHSDPNTAAKMGTSLAIALLGYLARVELEEMRIEQAHPSKPQPPQPRRPEKSLAALRAEARAGIMDEEDVHCAWSDGYARAKIEVLSELKQRVKGTELAEDYEALVEDLPAADRRAYQQEEDSRAELDEEHYQAYEDHLAGPPPPEPEQIPTPEPPAEEEIAPKPHFSGIQGMGRRLSLQGPFRDRDDDW